MKSPLPLPARGRGPLLVIAAGLLATSGVTAQTQEERGVAVAVEADRRDMGFDNFTASLRMVLRNRHGEESSRQMRNKTLEVDGDGDKTMIVFAEPRDIQGTALLTFTHREGQDDQWLYLPALRRVKRIASNNKSGPFMGSEFAYEDIASQEVEKYTYKYLGEEDLDGVQTVSIERYPVDPRSGYTRQIVWYDLEEYRPLQIDFYDRKDDLLKTLTYEGYQQYLDQYWRADVMRMVNHQNGKNTVLTFSDYEFRVGLTDRDFDQNSLRRAG